MSTNVFIKQKEGLIRMIMTFFCWFSFCFNKKFFNLLLPLNWGRAKQIPKCQVITFCHNFIELRRSWAKKAASIVQCKSIRWSIPAPVEGRSWSSQSKGLRCVYQPNSKSFCFCWVLQFKVKYEEKKGSLRHLPAEETNAMNHLLFSFVSIIHIFR